ncbi:MAG: response regulator [Magnetococcales bacterium]|nr:response regulator [Magnetococcales bacterium]
MTTDSQAPSPLSLRLLLIDDSSSLRMLFSTTLEAAGFTVVAEAANGKEGVERYLALRPDVTLLDIEMPVMDGTQALKAIMRADKGALVIMLTSVSHATVWEDCYLAGAKAYVRKDAPLADLPAKVAEVWRESRRC